MTKTTIKLRQINLAHDAAQKVRTALDRKACPAAWMEIAYEATVAAFMDAMEKKA